MSTPARERLEVAYASTGVVHVDRGGGGTEAPVLLALHGYGQPTEVMQDFAREVAPASWTVVVPEGPSSFYRLARRPAGTPRAVGHGWIAARPRAPSDERNDAFLAAALDGAVAPNAPVHLLGFSQGVGVALHFALSQGERVRSIVALAGGLALEYRPRLARLAKRPVLWVSGTQDDAYPPAYTRALLEDLRAAGVDVEAHALAAGHDVLEPARALVRAWLAARG